MLGFVTAWPNSRPQQSQPLAITNRLELLSTDVAIIELPNTASTKNPTMVA